MSSRRGNIVTGHLPLRSGDCWVSLPCARFGSVRRRCHCNFRAHQQTLTLLLLGMVVFAFAASRALHTAWSLVPSFASGTKYKAARTFRGAAAYHSCLRGQQLPLRAVNEAGFEIGVRMSPEEAERLGIKPFGDGGADDSPSPRLKVYTHGPCATPNAKTFVIPCAHYRSMDPSDPGRQQLADTILKKLEDYGFVVLENLMPAEAVAPLEEEARQYLDQQHEGFVPQPLRANRMQLHLPFQLPWAHEWLVKHDLILETVARYVRNDLAGGRTQDEQQWGLVQWITSGAELDFFRGSDCDPKPGKLLTEPPTGCSDVGSADERGPWLGRVMVTKTPPLSPPQKHHRDINFPGPAAQLTIQVALTPLVANNGPLGYVPGSHRMLTPGYEVVANPPLGSLVLYDSFCEHHGIENHGDRDRYAMYYEFETRGIFSGYTDEHFGDQAAAHTYAFRMAVDPELRRKVEQLRR